MDNRDIFNELLMVIVYWSLDLEVQTFMDSIIKRPFSKS